MLTYSGCPGKESMKQVSHCLSLYAVWFSFIVLKLFSHKLLTAVCTLLWRVNIAHHFLFCFFHQQSAGGHWIKLVSIHLSDAISSETVLFRAKWLLWNTNRKPCAGGWTPRSLRLPGHQKWPKRPWGRNTSSISQKSSDIDRWLLLSVNRKS